jgi:hypothetical protein
MKTRRSPETPEELFSTLPDDAKQLIFNNLNGSESISLLRTSLRLFGSLAKQISQREDYPLRRLLSHGALGELDQAKIYWEKDPSLLTCYGTVYHPNLDYTVNPPIAIQNSLGRYKYENRTFWQILLMNEEWEEAKTAGELMTAEEKLNQFLEVFPEGKILKQDWDLENAKSLLKLKAVFDAIINDQTIDGNNLDQMSAATRKALEELYAYVRPKAFHRTGLVFDADIYLAALDLYRDDKLQGFNHCRFWNVRVEEVLASLLPTAYLRPHAQGIFRDKVSRDGCVISDKTSYFSFRRPSNSLPGLHFWVDGFGADRYSMATGGLGLTRVALSKIMSSNNESKDRLYAAIFTRQTPACLIL